MHAGRMNTRVEIRRPVETNTAGSLEVSFPSSAARGRRWANRRGLGVTERFRAQQLDANADYVFMFHSDSVTRAISVKDRLLVGATSAPNHVWYDIEGSHDPDGRRKIITVYASARHED